MTSQKKSQTACELAKSSSEAMHEKDYCAQSLNIQPLDVTPGKSTVVMKIRDDMVNGHNICHGGMIFTLADTAFAHACNSYNNITVASSCSIEFVRPAKLNDTLTAKAVEKSLSGRTGVYDVTVTNEQNQVIAYFRGRSHRIKGHLVKEENLT